MIYVSDKTRKSCSLVKDRRQIADWTQSRIANPSCYVRIRYHTDPVKDLRYWMEYRMNIIITILRYLRRRFSCKFGNPQNIFIGGFISNDIMPNIDVVW